MLATPLYRLFEKVSNPQKFFKKQFIAAAFAGFVIAYGAAGAIIYNAIQDERRKKGNVELTDLFSLSLIKKHGKKGAAAIGIGYAGDVSLIYGVAGIVYWRRKRRQKEQKTNSPSNNHPQ